MKKFIVVAAAIAAFGLLDGASVGVSSGGFIYMISVLGYGLFKLVLLAV